MTSVPPNSTRKTPRINYAYYRGDSPAKLRRDLFETQVDRRECEATGDHRTAEFIEQFERDREILLARAARVGVADPLGKHFPVERLDDLKERAPLVDVIRHFDLGVPAPLGRRWKMLCPLHQESTPSFVVFEEGQRWKCFGCGESGDALDLLIETGQAQAFPEAIEQLARLAGVDPAPYLQRPRQQRPTLRSGVSRVR